LSQLNSSSVQSQLKAAGIGRHCKTRSVNTTGSISTTYDSITNPDPCRDSEFIWIRAGVWKRKP
jgi:hypothetical protein